MVHKVHSPYYKPLKFTFLVHIRSVYMLRIFRRNRSTCITLLITGEHLKIKLNSNMTLKYSIYEMH